MRLTKKMDGPAGRAGLSAVHMAIMIARQVPKKGYFGGPGEWTADPVSDMHPKNPCTCQDYRRRGSNRRAEMLKEELGDDDEDQEMPPFEDRPPQQPGPSYQDPEMAGGYGPGPDYGPPMRTGMSYEAPPPDPPMMRSEMPDRLASTGASIKIPGLDEPHLPMPNLNLQLPQSGQSASLPMQTSASALSTSGQYLATPYLAPASPQAAFTTQLPSYPSAAVASPGSRVYTTTLPAQFAPSGSVHIAPASGPAPVVTVPTAYTTSYSLPPSQQ
ncbi:KCNH2 [Symbiodinium pilosum]|uniref:KCNH2 protein n=1 Tax=Symbiodinium pilosum TaxID=2952 RepID=A0A812XM94_SYMPI|nr:KCNH2 [Symbiodinium pilosum]